MRYTMSMETQLTSVRLHPETLRQMRELARIWGESQTGTIARSVERAYQQERQNMDRVSELNTLRQSADDAYSNVSCTVNEYLALNPDETVAEYVQAVIDTDLAYITDRDDLRFVRNHLAKLANADLNES